LCFVRLAKRANRHADNDLVDSLGLAGVTGDGYSLVDMQSGAVANDLAFVQYDLALINADYGPQLVVEELLPSVFDVFREPDPVADRERDLLPLEHAEIARLIKWQLLLDAYRMRAYGGGMSRSLQILRTNEFERLGQNRAKPYQQLFAGPFLSVDAADLSDPPI
jgi:hypothetical protein